MFRGAPGARGGGAPGGTGGRGAPRHPMRVGRRVRPARSAPRSPWPPPPPHPPGVAAPGLPSPGPVGASAASSSLYSPPAASSWGGGHLDYPNPRHDGASNALEERDRSPGAGRGAEGDGRPVPRRGPPDHAGQRLRRPQPRPRRVALHARPRRGGVRRPGRAKPPPARRRMRPRRLPTAVRRRRPTAAAPPSRSSRLAAAEAPRGPAAEAAPAARPPSPRRRAGDPSLWRWLGALDGAARSRRSERVNELSADPHLDVALGRAREGRSLLRSLSRSLGSAADQERLYDLYAKHLAATNDEGSRKDADGMLGDAVRRADDRLSDGESDGATSALARALAFATAAGLEGRVGSKIQRKLGRAHQLAGRYPEATVCYRDALDAPARRRPLPLRAARRPRADHARGARHPRPPPEGRAAPRIAEEAERMLTEGGAGGSGGEGESYNAIYTLGVLAYERRRLPDGRRALPRGRPPHARDAREGAHRPRALALLPRREPRCAAAPPARRSPRPWAT